MNLLERARWLPCHWTPVGVLMPCPNGCANLLGGMHLARPQRPHQPQHLHNEPQKEAARSWHVPRLLTRAHPHRKDDTKRIPYHLCSRPLQPLLAGHHSDEYSQAERQTTKDNCPEVPVLGDDALVNGAVVARGSHGPVELQASCYGGGCEPQLGEVRPAFDTSCQKGLQQK